MVMWRKDCEYCHQDAFTISGAAHQYMHDLLVRIEQANAVQLVSEVDKIEITSETERSLSYAEDALEDALDAIRQLLSR